MVNKLSERGWTILNGSWGKQGEWTYIGERGSSVIDYVVANEKVREEIKRMKEGDRTESDHVPLEVELEGTSRRVLERKDSVEVERTVWTREGVEHYHEECEGWTCLSENNEKMWTEMKNKVKKSIMKNKKKVIPWRLGRKEWHSKEWKKKKGS